MKKRFRQRPWNRVSMPVYSLSTFAAGKANMNICTYVMPISLHGRKKYMLAIDPGSFTYQQLQQYPYAVLQVLSKQQLPLVRWLGYRHGQETDKLLPLQHRLAYYHGLPYLKDACAIIYMHILQQFDVHADHACLIAEVLHFKNLNNSRPLYTHDVSNAGIIRI
ncbi:MAG: flavin reductase family protein [Thermoflavifilum sp.]|nr:flavin reductase family protein [Thermoflavifilum sp.]